MILYTNPRKISTPVHTDNITDAMCVCILTSCRCVRYKNAMSLWMHIKERIEYLCNSERLGGSVISRDKHTLVLYNCATITNRQIQDILKFHPRYEVEIIARSDGFMVLFVEDGVDFFMYSTEFFCIVVSCMLVVINFSSLW